MKFLNSNRTLCLSPHPDDAEYSVGGTILKCLATQFTVFALSEGGRQDSTKGDQRIQEARTFWTGKDVYYWSLETSIEGASEGTVIKGLEQNHDLSQFDTLLIPAAEDCHHFHRFVNSVGQALARVRPLTVVEYCTPSVRPTWTSNMAVGITEHYLEKKRRLKAFKSQQHHSYFSEHCLDAFHSDIHYAKKGMVWIERFKILNLNL